MGRKGIATWVSLAMVLSLIVIIIEIAQIIEAPTIWYVDDVPGSGGPGDPPEDFTSIQDAINAAIDGDTVFVYNQYLEIRHKRTKVHHWFSTSRRDAQCPGMG